jgi:hypothetical protein
VRAAAGLLVAGALLAGCGGSGAPRTGEAAKSAQQIIADAERAAAQAKSMHLAGTLVQGGQSFTIDISSTRGHRAVGSFSLNGATVGFVRIGNAMYVRAGAKFWKRTIGTAAARLLQGKWLEAPASGKGFAQFVGITNPTGLLKVLARNSAQASNNGYTTYQGQKVIELDDSVGGKLYIAAKGPPYPLALMGSDSSTSGDLTFDRWNAPVSITRPKGAIDVSQLGSLGA